MPFKRFVETGRVAYISNGPHSGKLCAIVDVIDQTRVLVDGPAAGVPRIALRMNQIRLTKFSMKFPFTSKTRVVRKTWAANKIDEKWKDSLWAKKLAAKRLRRSLSDFDRFKLRNARRIRNGIRSVQYHKMLRADNKLREKQRVENKGKKGWGRAPKKAKK